MRARAGLLAYQIASVCARFTLDVRARGEETLKLEGMRDKVSAPTMELLRVLMWLIAKTAADDHCVTVCVCVAHAAECRAAHIRLAVEHAAGKRHAQQPALPARQHTHTICVPARARASVQPHAFARKRRARARAQKAYNNLKPGGWCYPSWCVIERHQQPHGRWWIAAERRGHRHRSTVNV